MTRDLGIGREAFALAIAVQNIVWGAAQPFVGILADKFGTARTLIGGAILYGAGLALMAYSTDPVSLQLTAGVILGLGIAGSAFFLVLAAFARLLPEHMRSLAYGLGTAAGSLGQFVFAPLGQAFVQAYGWHVTLLILSATMVLVLPLTAAVRGRPGFAGSGAQQTVRAAIAEAFGHGSYRWLVAGFFVCGFHIAFITNHLPPYLNDIGIAPQWGGYALGTIGLFNVIGSIATGLLSTRMPKRWVLSALYTARSVAIALFILTPPSILSLMLFSAAMGLLWLSTVPPTQGLVAVMFGTRYMATLFGVVFFSHQVGAFLGVWLGGRLYDSTGSYQLVWWLAVALGLFAALVHLPIRERPVARLAPAA
jgi:MFS family permease